MDSIQISDSLIDDLKKNFESSKNDGIDVSKNIKEEILEEPDCAEEQPSKVETTVIEALQMQVDEYKEKYLRALADYKNLKKKSTNEYLNGFKDGQNKLIEELLPFIDNFERMIDYELDYKGAMLVYDSLKAMLNANKIDVINPDNCDLFDEKLHEAIFISSTNIKELDNHIDKTFTKGYKHNDIIIRYAKVSVYKYQEQ